ncbi:MAG: SDR family NAD(P)-dependent oxidoreductase [Chitinophagales bacterium]|nr:SDR family NAD(P)-dependent oxidoreductase [Chitinophagales bacterium]
MDIRSKIAIVTGASSGLGKAITEALVRNGATEVYGIGRNTKALEKLQTELGGAFIPVTMDISHREDVVDWVKSTFSNHHAPDILINNAGVGNFARIDEMNPDDWLAMINTNLNGLYYITAEVVKLMRKKEGYQHIINIGSIMGTISHSEGAGYSATKFGVNGISEALFKELRGDNIKVSCINSGSIKTSFFDSSGIKAHSNMLHADEVADILIFILKTPDNLLIDEIMFRPLNPKAPE